MNYPHYSFLNKKNKKNNLNKTTLILQMFGVCSDTNFLKQIMKNNDKLAM